MDIPNEEHMYRLLDELAENCTCTDLICLYCQAEDAIDSLLLHAIINQYQTRRRVWRCHR